MTRVVAYETKSLVKFCNAISISGRWHEGEGNL